MTERLLPRSENLTPDELSFIKQIRTSQSDTDTPEPQYLTDLSLEELYGLRDNSSIIERGWYPTVKLIRTDPVSGERSIVYEEDENTAEEFLIVIANDTTHTNQLIKIISDVSTGSINVNSPRNDRQIFIDKISQDDNFLSDIIFNIQDIESSRTDLINDVIRKQEAMSILASYYDFDNNSLNQILEHLINDDEGTIVSVQLDLLGYGLSGYKDEKTREVYGSLMYKKPEIEGIDEEERATRKKFEDQLVEIFKSSIGETSFFNEERTENLIKIRFKLISENGTDNYITLQEALEKFSIEENPDAFMDFQQLLDHASMLNTSED